MCVGVQTHHRKRETNNLGHRCGRGSVSCLSDVVEDPRLILPPRVRVPKEINNTNKERDREKEPLVCGVYSAGHTRVHVCGF